MAEQPTEEVDVFSNRERRVEVLAEPLRHVGDPRADTLAVPGAAHVAVEHRHPAGPDRPRAGDDRQKARLADAVRPDEPGHDTGGQAKCDVLERRASAVA